LQWLEYGNADIQSASASWVFPLLGLVEYHKNEVEKAKTDVKNILAVLDSHLKLRTFLVGERVSLADLAVAADLALLYQYVLDAKFREPYVNVNRWFSTLINQQHFKSVLGEFKLCDKELEYNGNLREF
jgi:elongation factor 1-gamma